jgi:hypothetical protein
MILQKLNKCKGLILLIFVLIISTSETYSQTYKRSQIRLAISDSSVFFNHELLPILTTRNRKVKPSEINKHPDTSNIIIISNQELFYVKQNLRFKFRLISDDDFNPILDWHLKVLDTNGKSIFLWRPVYLWHSLLFVEISSYFFKKNKSIERYRHTIVYEIKSD